LLTAPADTLDFFINGFVFSANFLIAPHGRTLGGRTINTPAALTRRRLRGSTILTVRS
jgi:hypothetical protein